MAYLLVVRPLNLRELRSALARSPYSCDMANTGAKGEVWIWGPEPATVEVIAEIRHMIRNVPMMKRTLRNPHYFTITPEDWKWLQEEPISSEWWLTHVCPYSIGQANWGALHCPSGLTYVLCLPAEPKGSPHYLHSWCMTEEWVAPSKKEPKRGATTSVWPTATGEPVIKVPGT